VLDDKTIFPDEAMMARFYTINAHDPQDRADDEPAVDPDQDGKVSAPLTAISGAPTAIALDIRAPSLRPPT